MMRYSRSVQMVLVAVMVAAAVASYKFVAEPERDWVRVARDPNYDIAIDRGRVKALEVAARGQWHKALEVWYRTDHAAPRMHNGKSFDREVVRAIVWCDSLLFKVLSVDMSKREGRLVARQRTSDEELWSQRWRRVERETTEEIAATAACHFGQQRSLAEVP